MEHERLLHFGSRKEFFYNSRMTNKIQRKRLVIIEGNELQKLARVELRFVNFS